MAFVADQHHIAAGAAMPHDFHVHFRHQRTGGVEYLEPALRRFAAHGLRDAVRAEDDGGAGRHFVEFLDENRAALAQVLDDETVVHDFVAHVDRRAQGFDRALDDLDGAIDAGAETSGIGEHDVHAGHYPLFFAPKLNNTSPMAPPTMQESAMLNTGQW